MASGDVAVSIDHTLSWEVARVGGILAYVLMTVSVVLGLLVSLKTHSARWPRFITNELHRHVSLLVLVFIAIHTLAVWVDPFTGFNPTEVLLPLTAHYRPLWIAFGIVAAYLASAVWLSEHLRNRVGYAWWHRFHMLTFVVFLLGTVHGLGAGSDSSTAWAAVVYGGSVLVVAALVVVRAGRALAGHPGMVVAATVGVVVVALAFFAARGPLYPGWNAVANNGNGNGASQAWLAAHPTSGPPQDFATDLRLQPIRDDLLDAHFDGAIAGELQILVDRSVSMLAVVFSDGWSCRGDLTITGEQAAISRCIGTDGVALGLKLTGLETDDEAVVGHLQVTRV